jgi:hypothetical protein
VTPVVLNPKQEFHNFVDELFKNEPKLKTLNDTKEQGVNEALRYQQMP